MKQSKDSKTYSETIRERLKLKALAASTSFNKKYPHAKKFFADRGMELGKVRHHSAKVLGASALTGVLLLSPPTNLKLLPSPHELIQSETNLNPSQYDLVRILKKVLPIKTRPLSRNEEKILESVIKSIMGVNTRATLEGEHLNTTYGRIGAEQHLKRYPGDRLIDHVAHTDSKYDSDEILKEGIAPGLGAWGYFAKSQDQITPDLIETEKWYAVVQTLYLPDWNTRFLYLRDWYKYRKVLIINTNNGNAVVAAIADSGPAAWTGKHFGGSPEVMYYLGGERYKKGSVLVFFVDDSENKVPLGPVEYNKIGLPEEELTKT